MIQRIVQEHIDTKKLYLSDLPIHNAGRTTLSDSQKVEIALNHSKRKFGGYRPRKVSNEEKRLKELKEKKELQEKNEQKKEKEKEQKQIIEKPKCAGKIDYLRRVMTNSEIDELCDRYVESDYQRVMPPRKKICLLKEQKIIEKVEIEQDEVSIGGNTWKSST